MQVVAKRDEDGCTYIRQSKFQIENCHKEQRRALYNDKVINIQRRHNNSKYKQTL